MIGRTVKARFCGEVKMMRGSLFLNAIGKFAAGVLLVGLLLFVPAGTLAFPDGWLLMAILFVPMFASGLVMLFFAPELLRRRLNAREAEAEQKQVVLLSGLLFLTAFVLAGLNFRFQWLVLPRWIVWTAAAVFLLSYLAYAEVLRENAYLSRTIEVQSGQKVIDTGLYGVVRHPMYAATLILFLSMPLVLGSLFSFAVLLLYIPLLVKRIRNEEAVLTAGLDGYADYCARVRWRLVPFIW